MSSKLYPEEFNIEAVKQVTDRGHPAAEVASRMGVSLLTLYEWLKRYIASQRPSEVSYKAWQRSFGGFGRIAANKSSRADH